VITQFRDKFSFLSNFYLAPIRYEGVVYPSVEHAYQATKCPEGRETIRRAPKPYKAKWLGRKFRARPDWDEIKIGVMEDLVWLKFSMNPDLTKLLLDTGDEKIVEGQWRGTYWAHDNFWGNCECDACVNIPGRNHLGRILMGVRERLRLQQIRGG